MKNAILEKMSTVKSLASICMVSVSLLGITSCEKEEVQETSLIEEMAFNDPEQSKDYFYNSEGELVGNSDNQNNYTSISNTNSSLAKRDDSSFDSRVVFYSDKDLKGRRSNIFSQRQRGVNRQLPSNMKNQISSMVVAPNCRVVLRDKNRRILSTYGNKNSNYPSLIGFVGATYNDKAVYYDFDCQQSSRSGDSNFVGYAYDHKNFRGNSLPLYEAPNYYLAPQYAPGWKNMKIASISMNKNNSNGAVLLQHKGYNNHPLIHLNKNQDANYLHHLHERRNLVLHMDPRTTEYKIPEIQGKEIEDFIENIKKQEISVKPEVTRAQLGVMCAAAANECETVNANHEVFSLGADAVCMVSSNLFFSELRASKKAKAAWNGIKSGIQGSGKALSKEVIKHVGEQTAVNSGRFFLKGAASLAGCLTGIHATTHVAYLKDCKNLRAECMDSKFFNKVKVKG